MSALRSVITLTVFIRSRKVQTTPRSDGGAQQLQGVYVTTNTFPFLGVQPLLGRWIDDADGKPGAPSVFVMSFTWKEQFNGDPKVLGTALTLNGESRTLVGIMPPRFRYFGAPVYFPLSLSRNAADARDEYNRPRYLVAEERRKPGDPASRGGGHTRDRATSCQCLSDRLSKALQHLDRFARK